MEFVFSLSGQTHKEDFSTGTAAALAGGITLVCAMPNTSKFFSVRIYCLFVELLFCFCLFVKFGSFDLTVSFFKR